MGRFIEASEAANQKLEEVRSQHFPQLRNATIKVLFDTKMRKKGGKLVLGRIMKCNDLIRKLTDDIVEEGCDYIMFLDKVVFENINEIDRTRLVRHELRHCKVEGDEEKPKYKVIPHDIEDFKIEIELNSDKVDWASDAANLAIEIYAQMADQEKDSKRQPSPASPVQGTNNSFPRRMMRRG